MSKISGLLASNKNLSVLVACFTLFLLISFGCGSGGGGGSVMLPPSGVSGMITGRVTSDGSIILANFTSGAKGNIAYSTAGVASAEVWLEEKPELRVNTDAEGRFALENIPFGTHRLVAKVETPLKFYLVRSSPLSLRESTPVADAGELMLLEAVERVQGIIRSIDDKPLSLVTMTLWGMSFTTDSEGRFITPPLPSNETIAEIKITNAPGHKIKTFTAPIQPGAVPEFEVALSPVNEDKVAPTVFLSTTGVNVARNQQVRIDAIATTGDGRSPSLLKTDWSATRGVLATSTDRLRADWTAPDFDTTATITIRVVDENDLSASARLAFKVGTGVEPKNNRPVLSNLGIAGNSGDISITFDLSDEEEDSCSLAVFYSIDGGESFEATTNLTGKTTGLAPGENISIVWKSVADISGNEGAVVVRLVPSDSFGTGDPIQSESFAVSNSDENSPPVISQLVTSGSAGAITISFNLADAEGDLCSLEVFYSTDNGDNFTRTDNVTGATENLEPEDGLSIIWNSASDVTGDYTNVVVQLVAHDGKTSGIPAVSSAFLLSNNGLPSITNVGINGDSGMIKITFDLADPENDACEIAVMLSTDRGESFGALSSVSGDLSGVSPGENLEIIWDSAQEVPSFQSGLVIRLIPSDDTGVGSPGDSSPFSVNNNTLPVVTNVEASGTVGNILLTFDLSDAENDLCSIFVEFSTDGGAIFASTANLTGTRTGIAPGAGRNIVWNSAADIVGDSENVRVKVIPNDGTGTGTAGISQIFQVINNDLPVISSVGVTGNSGDILLTYTLQDPNDDLCTLSVFYSIDGGSNYVETTELTGATANVSSGNNKTLVWHSIRDIGGNENNLRVKIIANDGTGNGIPGESSVFAVTNNVLPVVSNVRVSGNSGNIVVTYDLTEPNNDPCSISLFYSVDNGQNYVQTTDISGSLTNIFQGSDKILTWNSTANIPGNAANVKLKVVARDGQSDGIPGESGAFPVNNNQLPVISGVAVSGSSGSIAISYTLTDGNNDSCNVQLFYSVDGGVNYAQTGNVSGLVTGVTPGANISLLWNSKEDVTGNESSVRLRLVANDGYGNGTPGESSVFAVTNNTPPQVQGVVAQSDSGNIQITYNLIDADNHECSIEVFFSINGGSTYTRTENLTGPVASIAPGAGRSITWVSRDDISGNQDNVKIRIVPNDGFEVGTSGESEVFAVLNNTPPVVSNIRTDGSSGNIIVTYDLEDADNHNCSILVAFSTDNGETFSDATSISGNLSNVTPGQNLTLSWNSSIDVPGDVDNVRLKLVANDGFDNSIPATSAPFTVGNNQPPAVRNVTVSGNTGDITLTYTLEDELLHRGNLLRRAGLMS